MVSIRGHRFKNENTTRTRSFLFLALGLALASVDEVELGTPENGFASLNPPLGPDQLGSLSTRTTHPWFLTELSGLVSAAGAWGTLSNPFAAQTKGEMFRWLADQVGDGPASDLLSATNSCAFTNRRWLGVTATDHRARQLLQRLLANQRVPTPNRVMRRHGPRQRRGKVRTLSRYLRSSPR